MTQAPAGPPAAAVADVELSGPLPDLHPDQGAQAWLLVRLFTEPLGLVVIDVPPAGCPAEEVLRHIVAELGVAIATRLGQAGLVMSDLGAGAIVPPAEPPFLRRRTEVLRTAPEITVVICTRDRPEGLRTTLEGLLDQEYPHFRVLVVDNASVDDRTRDVAAEFEKKLDLRYVHHPVPGLSRARNRGLAEARTDVVAWLDDDASPDRYWLAELARGFAAAPGTVAVSGSVVPRTLDHREQVWFEQFGGHSKGRGFTQAVFSPDTHARQSPLYPLPPFGVGANMAFHAPALRAVGGFDEALGAGTRTRGGEDTRAFTEVMLHGGTMVYQPAAVVRHEHRRTLDALRAQLDGYGTGLTAYYVGLLLEKPTRLLPLLRLLPKALRDLRGPGSLRTATLGEDFPPELLASNLRAMLRGPIQYLLQRRDNRLTDRGGRW